MTNQSNTPQPVLTDEEIMRSAINASDSLNITRFHGMGAPSRTIMDDAGLLELGRAIETALLSKLRAPVADERISLRGAANLAFNALHECKPVKGAEKQYSDAIQALQSALHDIAYTVNRTATPQQFADHLQREARAALAAQPAAADLDAAHARGYREGVKAEKEFAAGQPAASAEPSDKEILRVADEVHQTGWNLDGVPDGLLIDFARALLSRYGRPAGGARPVAWVASDTLNSPHPTCISSLAYMSQLDRKRGRAYVPLAIIDRYAAPSSAQPAVNGYTCTVPDDCETLHWRGQILSMNELAAQKAGDGDALRRLADEKFFSGNAVPVERITITRAEYDAAMQQQSRENK